MMHFSRKEKVTACFLLGLPLALALFVTFPHYEKYTAPGHIVRISELGIYGHVYMTYVEEGVTSNFLQKLVMVAQHETDELSFEPYSREQLDDNDEEIAEAEPYKEAVVTNALEVSGYAHQSEQAVDQKYERIMKESQAYVGDSFGLMVGIGLVEEESRIDFSHGTTYRIAGTGTLEDDGSIGSVGGIKQKIATAAKEKVDFFFIPKDKDNFLYDGPSNQEEAEQYARTHPLRMKIIPVATLDEALSYLKNLP